VLTIRGVRGLFLLAFLHVETRRVFIAPSTFHPHEAWVKEQAQAFLQHVDETGLETTIVMHDRDTKFTQSFDEVLESAGLEVNTDAYRLPNTNAFVERFIQTLQQECLDYFIVFGEQHMDHIVKEMVGHYHEERPHQSKENDPLVPVAPEVGPCSGKRNQRDEALRDVIPVSQVECRQRLSGPLKHYYRRVA
jgi:putative transposase